MREALWFVGVSIVLLAAPAAAQSSGAASEVHEETDAEADAASDESTDQEESTEPAAAAASKVQVELLSNQPGVAFHYARARSSGSRAPGKWTRICLSECTLALPRGNYHWGLSLGAGEVVPAPQPFELTGPVKLEGAYSAKGDRRLAGWLVLGLGTVSSLASASTGAFLLSTGTTSNEDVGKATLIGGLVGLLTSLVIGVPLASVSDAAAVAQADGAP